MTQPNLAPAQPVASPEDSIERVPWQLPEPGSPSHTKPHWRLVTWAKRPGTDDARPGDYIIQDVLSHERLAVVIEQPAWKHHRWFATEVDRAIKAIGWIDAEPDDDGTESALARIKRRNALGKLYVDGNASAPLATAHPVQKQVSMANDKKPIWICPICLARKECFRDAERCAASHGSDPDRLSARTRKER